MFGGEHISYYWCAAHILNLAIKDIMQLETHSLLGDYAENICLDFKQSQELSSLLKEILNSKADINIKKLTLILLNVKHWVTYVHCLKNLILNKLYLLQVANSPKAINYLSKTSSVKILGK